MTGKVKVEKLDVKVAPNCYVLDDEIASGGTIITALSELEKHGARRMIVIATHPVFSGKASEVLQNSSAEKVIVTDSIPVKKVKRFKKLEVLTLSDIICKQI
jgi:ribose-phosphate pyrophosphokinase